MGGELLWLEVLRLINKSTPPDKATYIVGDKYATHNHPEVNSWLKSHKPFNFTSRRPAIRN